MSLTTHRLIDRAEDVAYTARALTKGAVVATAFGNFYVIVTNPAAATVRRVNLAKGRPPDQVGSITTAAPRIPGMFDWSGLSQRLSRTRIRELMDALYAQGPFGFRGPAADHIPDHLTQTDQGVRTTQVIAPGAACPSNRFFDEAAVLMGGRPLYITSANRSRHLTGAAEEPAHWRASGIAADFAHVAELVIIEHRDEAAARAAYPPYLPTSVTLLSFHAPVIGPRGRPVLTVDRHGSLSIEDVRRVAEPLGFDIVLGATAQRRLQVREYATEVHA
jgi:tRNA A37 threonylcarbamoyladenosine synthetase subunit TsaC/SUA5/YrdC